MQKGRASSKPAGFDVCMTGTERDAGARPAEEKENRIPKWIRRGILSWLFAVTLEIFLLPPALRSLSGTDGLAKMSLLRLVLVTAGGLLLLGGADFLRNRRGSRPDDKKRSPERWLILLLFLTDAVVLLTASFTWGLLGACVLIAGLLAVEACKGRKKGAPRIAVPQEEDTIWPWLLAVFAAAVCAFDCIWLVSRIGSFSSPTYDFGIFSQMFHYMRKTGLPMTTLEREGLYSHFRVHMSPIWYLMLPFYCIAPHPETLEVLQAVIVTSAVIPLYKIGRAHGLSSRACFFVCAAFLLYPPLLGGTSYDVHENCFLAPLILWILYGIDAKKAGVTAVSAVLTLLVKEDAAVFVAVIGVWTMVRSLLYRESDRRRTLLCGLALFIGALLWFLGVTAWLSKAGDGIMSGRYRNFMFGGSQSLFTVVKAVMLQPFKVLYESTEKEKLPLLALSVLPLLALPFWTRRYERYILLIPFVLVNLMSDFSYQHQLFYQYTFAPAAFLGYLAAVNLAEFRPERVRKGAAVVLLAACAAVFGFKIVPRAERYIGKCVRDRALFTGYRKVLSTIPKDARVASTTYFTPQLSARDLLYDVKYVKFEHLTEVEYVVLLAKEKTNYEKYRSPNADDGLERLCEQLEESGFRLLTPGDAKILIYHME